MMKTTTRIRGIVVSVMLLMSASVLVWNVSRRQSASNLSAGMAVASETATPAASTGRTASETATPADEEIVMYRNEEYGFEFQYPKTIMSHDGERKTIEMNEIDLSKASYKESLLFRLNSYTLLLSFNVERKPEDFHDLRSYGERVYQGIDDIIEKEQFTPVFHRKFQHIEIADQPALLVTSFGRQIESTIFIEKGPYLYLMHNSCLYVIYDHGENSSTFAEEGGYIQFLEDACHNRRLIAVQQIVKSFTFH